MKLNICSLSILAAFLFYSCKNGEQSSTPNSELNNSDTSQVSSNESIQERTVNIQNLLGKWKEIEYPFRLLHFTDSTVKLTEEGVVEAPRFKAYKISNTCPFEVNNIKNTKSDDNFLVMTQDSTCEIIKLSNDTLTLSGYSTHTNSDYKIYFGKIE